LDGIIKMVGFLYNELEIPFFGTYDELINTFNDKIKEQKTLKV